MRVTVDVVGGETKTVHLDGDTYGDVLTALDLSAHEASVFVDGRPKPADEHVTETDVQVVRLVRGG